MFMQGDGDDIDDGDGVGDGNGDGVGDGNGVGVGCVGDNNGITVSLSCDGGVNEHLLGIVDLYCISSTSLFRLVYGFFLGLSDIVVLVLFLFLF
jgi:hypothetical protein